MAFIDSAFMGIWVSLLKGSSCFDFVGTSGLSTPGGIVRHQAAVPGGGFFAWITRVGVHGAKFCRPAMESHSDAFRKNRNVSEPFAYRARISCPIFRDANQGSAMPFCVVFGLQLAFAGIPGVFRKNRNASEPVSAHLQEG
ncbi:hypothetical protein SDC9_183639 [bioreactor metagenome]|uniref:Uncharacterized protein n=1 Tax=bioreactor metagenome TaxID=1076179 RepID=A0A645HKH7_9ZZZZ